MSDVLFANEPLHHPTSNRSRIGRHDLGLVVELDADRAAALRLDGRDPVPHPARRGHVPRPRAVDAGACPGGCCTSTSSAARIFAAVSGSSAATCATIGKMSLPELQRRGYPRCMSLGSLAGAGTLGLLIPPSIIMIVYGVAADVSIAQLFIAGVHPRHPAGADLLGLDRAAGRCCTPSRSRRPTRAMSFAREAARVAQPDPGRAADRRRARLDLRRHRHRHRGGRAGRAWAR